MEGFTMKAASATRIAPLGAFLMLFATAACGGGGSNPTGPTAVPAAFSTIDLAVGAGEPVTR